jgi:hypothetical protein
LQGGHKFSVFLANFSSAIKCKLPLIELGA